MKKYVTLLIIITLTLVLTSCSKKSDSDVSVMQEQIKQLQAENDQLKNNKNTTGSSSVTGNASNNSNPISIGQSIQIADICEFKIKEAKFTNKVVPPNPGSFHTYYEVKDKANTFLEIIVEYKNLEGTGKEADEAVHVDVLYSNKYTYSSFSTIEESGGSDFTYTNITDIDPLKTGVLHFICEVPLEVKDSGNTVDATIKVNANKYTLKVK